MTIGVWGGKRDGGELYIQSRIAAGAKERKRERGREQKRAA